MQAAGDQHDKLGASFQIFPEFLQRDGAYKYSKESLGSLSKESVKVKTGFLLLIHHRIIQNLCSLFHVQIYSLL